MNINEKFFEIAIKESQKSLKTGDIPVGAVIVLNGKIVSKGHNTKEVTNNILGHAEINTILKASKKLSTWHLDDCELYVTLKPCTMCESVIKNSHIKQVYYLLDKQSDQKEFQKTKSMLITNDLSTQYNQILSSFFQNIRTK